MSFCYPLKVCPKWSLILVNVIEHQCPEKVCSYNLHMGNVILSDMRCYMFFCVMFLLSRVLVSNFILYQCNTKNVPKLNRWQFMVKLVEAGDFRAGRMKPGRKSVENPPDRLLFSEQHLKQTKLPIGIKNVFVQMWKKEKRVHTSYICEHCNVALCLGQFWEKYHTKNVLW